MLRQSSRICQSLVIFVVLVITGGPPTWAAPQPGGATPQEVFDRFKAATEPRNWEEIAACMAPGALEEMNAMMVLMGGMMVAFAEMGKGMAEEMAEGMVEPAGEGKGEVEQTQPAAPEVSELQKKFEALLASHGIDAKTMEEGPGADKVMPEALGSPKFFNDIMRFMDELPSEEGEGSPGETFPAPKGPLENLVIDGDHATATVGGEPGGFVRIDGRWYLDLDPGKDTESGGVEPGMEPEGGKGSQ